jgi:ABC-type glutathione transport system ATPase component
MPVKNSPERRNTILEVEDLCVSFAQAEFGRSRRALTGVTFELGRGQVVGLMGESGSGKSTLALSILRVLPESAAIDSGKILFCGTNLLEMSASELQRIRGARIAIIFQEPALALNPVMTVGSHITEVLRAHGMGKRSKRLEQARSLLRQVEIADVDRIIDSYPHQLSGGEAQRVLIAQALACGPEVLIADEPTASLDPPVQAELLQLLTRLRKERGLAVLFITHNPALLLDFADRVLVMDSGRIIEQGPTLEVFRNPKASFTKELVSAMAQRDVARAS